MIIILCDVLTLCFTVNLYEKRRKNVLVFWYFLSKIIYVWMCTKNILKKKKLIIIIDIVEYKILWMHASLMHGFRMDGGRTVRDPLPNFPASATIKILLAPGKNIWSAHGYFLVFITQVAWRFMAYTRDLIKRNHPI